jgi:hypothetical protein
MTAGTKFKVTFDDPKELKEGRLTEFPAHRQLYQTMPEPFAKRLLSVLGYWSAMGEFDFPGNPEEGMVLNVTFPDIKPRTMRDVLELRFGGSN